MDDAICFKVYIKTGNDQVAKQAKEQLAIYQTIHGEFR